jgi:hypothetical protein
MDQDIAVKLMMGECLNEWRVPKVMRIPGVDSVKMESAGGNVLICNHDRKSPIRLEPDNICPHADYVLIRWLTFGQLQNALAQERC